MSLAGLFALGIQTESLQVSSPSLQGNDESLDGEAFQNLLVALWEDYSDSASQPEEEAVEELLESEADKKVDSQASSDQSQPELEADFAQLAEALAAPVAQAGTSGGPADEGAPASSKAEGKADQPGFQEASAAHPTKPSQSTTSAATPFGEVPKGSGWRDTASAAGNLNGDNGSKVPSSAQGGAEGLSAELKAGTLPLGRKVEGLQQWEALARPVELEGKLPPQLERILGSGQEKSGLDARSLHSSLKTALTSQAAQAGTLRPAAGKPLAREAQAPSESFRPSSDVVPKGASEPSAEDGRDSDPSRHSHAGQRSGGSAANSAAFSQTASSGLRFAELVQTQPNAAQPGSASVEAPAAKAPATASGEGMQAETATVRGQSADQVFAQVVQHARLLQSQGEARFEIRLKPEFLGKIQIESRMGADHTMTTRFLVEDPEVRILLESRLPVLAERLGESGVRMSSLEVHSMNSQAGSDLSRSGGEAAGQGRQQQHGAGRQDPAGSLRAGSQPEEIQLPPRTRRGGGRIYLVA